MEAAATRSRPQRATDQAGDARVARPADGAKQLSRILAYTSPSRGHLFPLLPILQELRERGHAVALRSLSSETAALSSLGLEAAPIAPRIEALRMDDWMARTPIGAASRASKVFLARSDHEATDLRRAIDDEGPDALLVDILALGALSAAEAWGGPWASYCPLPLPLTSRDTPIFGPGMRPAGGPLGRLRDRICRRLFEEGFDRSALRQLNGLRAKLELPPLRHASDVFGKAPLLLYMTSEAFDYRRSDCPQNVVMVGPCAWDPPADLPRELIGVEAPLVLVTTSSEFQNDSALVRAALVGLADEPVHIVATVPFASTDGVRPPPNADVLPFASHTPILARAACAITHGGMGVTQKALARGVPVCAVPFGRDQFEVARRVEIAGAGSRLPAWRLHPDRLRTKVNEAISCRAGAECLADSFAVAGGPSAAADAFERRIASM